VPSTKFLSVSAASQPVSGTFACEQCGNELLVRRRLRYCPRCWHELLVSLLELLDLVEAGR
jgi:hypothetical protein